MTPIPWVFGLPYPLRNLLRRWRGLVGMMLGVGIALGISMLMLGVSNAELDLFTRDFRLSGANLYVSQQGGNLVPLLAGDSPGTIIHGTSTLAYVRGLPGVSGALGAVIWPLEREHPGLRHRDTATELILTMGVEGDPALLPNVLSLQQGHWLRRTDEVVLGARLARDKRLAVGDVLTLANRDFTVVGIGKLRGFGLNTDAVAYLDRRALRQRADVGDVLTLIVARTSRPAVAKQRLADLGGLTAVGPEALIQQATQAMSSAAAFRWIFIVLTLAIAGLFVSNLLGRSVAERRLEFATMRAIGLPRRTILSTVAAEAILVSLAASVVGVVVSTALGALINGYVAPQYGFERLYAATPGLFLTIVALALALGLLAGLVPARRATRVDPVAVLREA